MNWLWLNLPLMTVFFVLMTGDPAVAGVQASGPEAGPGAAELTRWPLQAGPGVLI